MTELRIQEVCKEKGMTMQDLAKRMNKSYQALYASIGNNPTLGRLDEIAVALGVPTIELFKKDEDIKVIIEYRGKTKYLTKSDLIDIFNRK